MTALDDCLQSGERPLVLVVDDDPAVRIGLSTHFAINGYRVATAADGQEALALYERRGAAAVVMDVKMPGLDGFRVCELMRDNNRQLPVILITGAQETIIRQYMPQMTQAAGGTVYVHKPLDFRHLTSLVDGALRL